MQQHYNSLAHELNAQVEASAQDIIRQELEKQGIQPGCIPEKAAIAVGEHLAVAWGGQQVYFPKDIPRRNARLYDEFTGNNASALARKYNLSTASIYQILASERERRRARQQHSTGSPGRGGRGKARGLPPSS